MFKINVALTLNIFELVFVCWVDLNPVLSSVALKKMNIAWPRVLIMFQ